MSLVEIFEKENLQDKGQMSPEDMKHIQAPIFALIKAWETQYPFTEESIHMDKKSRWAANSPLEETSSIHGQSYNPTIFRFRRENELEDVPCLFDLSLDAWNRDILVTLRFSGYPIPEDHNMYMDVSQALHAFAKWAKLALDTSRYEAIKECLVKAQQSIDAQGQRLLVNTPVLANA